MGEPTRSGALVNAPNERHRRVVGNRPVFVPLAAPRLRHPPSATSAWFGRDSTARNAIGLSNNRAKEADSWAPERGRLSGGNGASATGKGQVQGKSNRKSTEKELSSAGALVSSPLLVRGRLFAAGTAEPTPTAASPWRPTVSRSQSGGSVNAPRPRDAAGMGWLCPLSCGWWILPHGDGGNCG